MSNNDASFYVVRFDAILQTLQYAVGQSWVNVPSGPMGVTSLTGTANQVTATPSTGAVTVSLPSVVIISTSLQVPTTTSQLLKPATDAASGTSSIRVTDASGSLTVLGIETANGRLGILTSTPNQPLTVNGNARINGSLALGPANPSAACLIDMVNPFQGVGFPVMTSAQKTAITPNRAGNVVFDTDLVKLCVNTGSAWETITSA